MWKTRLLALSFLILGGAAGYFDAAHFLPGPDQLKIPFRLGLDLQGGTHLVYRADTFKIPQGEVGEAMAGLRDVIERRINIFGVTEPVIQVEKRGDENRLIVELAGVFNINDAIRAIGETPYLEFRSLKSGANLEELADRQNSGEKVNLDDYFIATELNGRFLKKAALEFDQTSLEPTVSVEFDEEGGRMFQAITKENVGKPVAIYLDGLPISIPIVQEEISQGRAQVSGNFTPEEARTLVRRLNSGALPVPIVLVSQQSVGASLGGEALEKMLKAGLYGTLAVVLFLLFFYRLPGFAAVVALAVYTATLLLLFKMIPVTLTAAGIAGFILSVGMAVDANILIFERTKEELRRGKSLRTSVEEGFLRAWLSIRDSNVSSLITSAILYWFGTSLVKGFALTLALGILMSMFSAIMVTRTFLRALEVREGRAAHFLFGAKPQIVNRES